MVHGTNMVYKLPPYYPAAAGFGDSDAAFLQSIGFNAVRVGLIWKAVEPQPGVYDDAYLNQIAGTVATLARHGIVSLLDFHQDMYNEEFQGEGAPNWAVQDGGLPNPKLGFPGNYTGNVALQHAFDAFWTNAKGPGGVGLQDRFASAGAHVAERFRNNRDVLGYELFNEPWPGTVWQQCAQPAGCPVFDAELSAFYRRVDAAVRAIDPRTPVWYEPNVLFNDGANTTIGALGDPQAGFAFHDYCVSFSGTGSYNGCDTPDNLVFSNALSHVAQTGEALLLTEFGATQNSNLLTAMVQRGDGEMVPWLEWAYCGCRDPTTAGPGAEQAIVVNPGQPATGSNLVLPSLRALVEPYPRVIAGTPQAWGFDKTTSTFHLSYTTARAGQTNRAFPPGSLTEIATPRFVYTRGYAAHVHGGAIVSPRAASVLQVVSCAGANTIAVTVSPSGAEGGSCRPGNPGKPTHRAHRGCPRATGRLRGKTLGHVRLGMTRAQARHFFAPRSSRGRRYEDFFCLSPIGIRVGYASPALLKTLSGRRRKAVQGRVIWASTANGYYTLRGVRPGAKVAVAGRRLKLTRPFHIGINYWYLAPHGASTGVLKVRHGIVEEIGIADEQLTESHKAQAAFLHSFF